MSLANHLGAVVDEFCPLTTLSATYHLEVLLISTTLHSALTKMHKTMKTELGHSISLPQRAEF